MYPARPTRALGNGCPSPSGENVEATPTLRLSTTPQAAESAAEAVENETDHVSKQHEAVLQQLTLPPPQTDVDNYNRRLERQQQLLLKAQLKKERLILKQRWRQGKAKGQTCSGLSPPGPSSHVDGSADLIMSKGALLATVVNESGLL